VLVFRNTYLFCLLFFTFSCTKNSSKFFSKKEIENIQIDSSLIKKKNFTIKFNSKPSDSITLKYLGYGGYYFSKGKAAFLIDPFFSPLGVFPLNLEKIATQTKNVERGLRDIKSDIYTNVDAIFITHSHYDHLMDAPYVFNHYFDTTRATTKIYGSSSTKALITPVVNSVHVEDIEGKSGSIDSKGEWIYLNGGGIRVMPIITEHAPQFNKLVSICLYWGQGVPIATYESDVAQTRVTDWKVGETYAFLIDFMDKEEIKFRIYLLSSSSTPPLGFVHAEVLKEHKVNLAILGAASFDNVENYPQGILTHLQPDKLLITHWEDLFKPYLHEPPRFMRASNFKKLIPEINEIYPWEKNQEQQFFMPVPGVFIYALY
jgi:metallo-beta-lactamase superfamily protein